MNKKKREPKYEICNPAPGANALVALAVLQHKDSVMEGLLATLWEQHQEEIVQDHHEDTNCSVCDTMRAACRALKMESPRFAAFCMPERGPLYREVDL